MAIRDITDDSVYTTINSANFANSEDDEDGNILTDSARDLGVGLVDLGGAAAGAADLVASPFRDKGDSTFTQAWNESAAGDWKRELQEGYSQARKDAEREYEEYMARGDGSTMDQFGRAVFGLATNPRAAIGRVFQSAPAMLAGGGVGGAVGKAALARGATTNAAKWAGRVGSGAAEGGISAGQVAGSIAEYNRENNLDPTQGMAAPVVTALGVGAIGTAGGGMEAGLFNKSLRETAKQSGVGAIPKTFAKEGFKEGAEEAAQAPFETVPENVATGKQWDEGLGRNMGEGFATGFGLGGALGTATKKNLLGDANEETTAKPYTRDVPPQEKEPVDVEGTGVKFQPTGDVEADAQRLVDEDTDVDDEGDVGSEEVEPAEEAAPMPQEEVAPGQPVEPAKSSIDEGGFRDLFDKIHAPDKAVPKAQLKKVNELFGSSPYGVDVVNAIVSARNEVGSPMNADGLLNIAQDAVRKSSSIEDAVEYLRDRATWYEENAKGKQDGIVKSDLCAVAAEYLAGNSDTMKFLEERRTARISAEAVAQADAVKQKELDAKAAAQAAEKVEGEVVEGDAQSRDEAMQERYRARKNGGKAPEAPAAAPTVAPTPEDITDVEAKPVESSTESAPVESKEASPVEEAPKAEAPEEKKPIDYDEKAPWVKPKKYESGPIGIREGVVVDPAKRAQEETAKREAHAKAQAEQPAAPQTAPEASVEVSEAKPVKAKKAKKPKEAIPNPSGQGSLFTEEELPMDAPPNEAPNAEAPKEEPKKVQVAIKPRKEHKSYGTVDDEPIQLVSRRRSAPTLDQTAVYDNAFEDYKAQFRERPNGDTASVEDHDAALEKVMSGAPKGTYHAGTLAGLAARVHTLSSTGIVTRFKTLLAISKKAQRLEPHEKKRVMDNVVSEARMMKMSEEHIEVLKDPSKYKDEPKGEAKATFTPPPLGDGKISDSDMGQLAALKASLPPSKEESKPVASIPTAETRAEEIETGKPVPTAAKPKGEVAPVAKEEKSEAPKGTAVGPAVKIEPIKEEDIPENLRKWSPNANVPASKLKDGKSVFKSHEEAVKADKPKNMSKWAESTYDYVVHAFYPEEKRWPTQEEYRDRIWPFLSKEDSFLPDNAVGLKTGRAWKRAWFGKITRGSQAVPSTGAKQAKADAKAQREATGRDLSEKLSKEWAQLAEEGKVDKGSKPQIHDVRAFLRRERESGAIDSGINIRHISKDVYDATLDTHAKSVFDHQANVAKVEAQKAREVARVNTEATAALPGNSQAKTGSGTVATAKGAAPAKQAGLPVPKTKAAADLIKTFPTTKVDDEAQVAVASEIIEEKLKGKTKQEEVDYLEDLLKDAHSFPVTGGKSTRYSVVAAVISRVFRNTALSDRSANKYTKSQFAQAINAISGLLNEETSPLDAKTLNKLNTFKDALAKQSTFGEEGVEALKKQMANEEVEYGEDVATDDSFDSDDSGADTAKGGPTENKMAGVFDDNTDEAEARQAAEEKARYEEKFGRDTSEDEDTTWDDDKVGGESGGSINVESGRSGKNVARRAKRALEGLAREFGWIGAKHKSGTGEKFDEAFEGTYETIKERYESASDEERQQVADAIKKWGKGIYYDKMHSEDLLEVGIFAGTIGQELELEEAGVVSKAAFDAYKAKITKPTEPEPPEGDSTESERSEKEDSNPGEVTKEEKLSASETLKGLREDSKPLPNFAAPDYMQAITREMATRKAKTSIGERLLKEARPMHVNASKTFDGFGSWPLGSGFALRFDYIFSQATCADDLVGVYSEPFAKNLWKAMEKLRELGIESVPNTWVIDGLITKNGEVLSLWPGIRTNTVGSAGKCIDLAEGVHIAVYEGGKWKRFVTEGRSCVITGLFKTNKFTGIAKDLYQYLEDSTLLHELVHAMDNLSGRALSKKVETEGKLGVDRLFSVASVVNKIYNALGKGVTQDRDIEALAKTLPDVEGVDKRVLATMAHNLCYPFIYVGEVRRMELVAVGVTGYLQSEAYRSVIKKVAPEFANLIEGMIENDIRNYQPVRGRSSADAGGTEVSTETQASASEIKKPSDIHSDKDDGRGETSLRNGGSRSTGGDHGDGKPRSQKESPSELPGDTNGDRGVPTSGETKSVRAGSRAHSPEMDGRTSAGPNPSNASGQGRADVGREEQGASPLRGPAPVEPRSAPRKEKRSVDDNGALPSGERVQQGQSRFYDIHHTNKKLTLKEQVQAAILNGFASAKNKGFLGLLFTRDLVSWATRAAPDVPAFKQWHDLLERQSAFRNDWQADVAGIKNRFDSIKDKKTRDAVNEFLELTTLDGVWAYRDEKAFPTESEWRKYVDSLKGEQRDTYNLLSDRFLTLPIDAQVVIQEVLRHGVDARITRAQMMKEVTLDRYTAMEELASSQKEKDAIRKERDDWVKKCDSLAKQHRQPYVPLRRFGDHVVVVKSKEYEYTERLASEVYRKLQKMHNGKPTPKQMSPYNKLRSKLVEMQADEAHYVVQFVQGSGSAKIRAKQLEARYPGSIVEHFARAEHVSSSVPSWQKLEQVISSAMEAMKAENIVADAASNRNTQAALAELTNAAQRMYIEALNDDNARKSELRRMKVAGYHTDMMENFTEAGKAEANLYANMSYGAKVRKVLSDMQEEVRHSSNRAEAADYQNEIFRRHNQMLSNKETGRGANALLRTNSFVMLLTSPAYYLQNLMQPMMMSAPYMAGHHGMGTSVAALSSAMAQAAKALKHGTTIENIATGMGLTDAERAALIRARDLGHIDIGMSSDFGRVTHTDANKAERALAFATDKITEISRRVEMVNRIGTFVAAYRLEQRRLNRAGKTGKAAAEAAWQYADEVVYKTHGDYSGVNAPRLFTANTFAKIATQFRKFQLIQAGMMIGLAKRAFAGASPLEKAIARRQLAWTMGIHFAMAGAKGTPFIATLLWAMGFVFGGSDDDDDMIRDYIKDKETSDLLLNGIPKWLGIDMSQKVGAGNMLSPFPFLEVKPQNGEDLWKDIVVSLMGPTGSLGERAFRAIQYGYQGDYYKGVEAAAPTGVANVMKAFRFGSDGVTTKAGDVHIPGEDFTFMELVAQAAGLPPNKITDRNRVMGSLIRHEEWYDKEQNRINHDYKEAFRTRDTRGMMEARKRHRELNEQRREEGFKVVPMSRLTKTATDQRKREFKGQAIGSTVGVKPSNRRFIQDQLKK